MMSAATTAAPRPFWNYLQTRLADLDLTMSELARQSGVKVQAIYKWREAQPSVQSVRKIAGALHDEPSKLLVIAGHVAADEVGVTTTKPREHDLEAAVRNSTVLTRTQKNMMMEMVRAFVALNAAEHRRATRKRTP